MKRLKYFKQPNNKTCGQTTIAMIAGITPTESIKLFGHNGTSKYEDYVRVLKELDIKHDKWKKVDNRRKYNLPNKAIIRMNKSGRDNGHLVAYYNGVFYDPWYGVFNSKEKFLKYWNDRRRCKAKWRIDWYMEILDEPKYSKVAGR